MSCVPSVLCSAEQYRAIEDVLEKTGGCVIYLPKADVSLRLGKDIFLDGNPRWGVTVLQDITGSSQAVWRSTAPHRLAKEVLQEEITANLKDIQAYLARKTFAGLPPQKIAKAKIGSVVICTIWLGEVLVHLVRQTKCPLGKGTFFKAEGMGVLDDQGRMLDGCCAFLKPVSKDPKNLLSQMVNRTESAAVRYCKALPHVHVDEVAFFNAEETKGYLVAPLAEKSGIDLIIEPKEMMQMFRDLARGLWDLHRIGYCSGDIKRANTLCFKGIWKLSDNVFKLRGTPSPLTQTIAYISPQHREFLQHQFVHFYRGCQGLLDQCLPDLDHPDFAYDVKPEDEVFSLGICFIDVYFAPLKEGFPFPSKEIVEGIAFMINRMTGVDIRLFSTFRELMDVVDPVDPVLRDSRLGEAYFDPFKRPTALEVAEYFREMHARL